jgi:cytosine/adenosine deaminase-related metal-dependent hydrolase
MGFSTLHTMSDELLGTCVAAARRHGWAIHSHLAEVKEEAAQTRMEFGATNLERAQRSGLLDLDVVFAHCIWVLEPDVHTLCEHSSTVVHNPVSNMILGSGLCPVPRLRAAGIPVGLGTDGCASNDSHDMLGVIKTAPLLQKLQHLDPSVLTARDSLRMATIDGARALRIDDIVGSLEPGKRADLIRFSGAGTRLAYVHDPYQQIAYCAGTGDIADVWIEGQQVVGDGAVLTVSEPDVVRDARALAYELFTAARLAEHLPSGGHPDIGTLTLSGSD